MKLVIQIPCWNEEHSIADAIKSLPRHIDGIDSIEIMVIDDGSSDATADMAARCGVHEVIKLPRHKGLASAFSAGVQAALQRGADILVNTDADLQYPSHHIKDLIAPVLDNSADIVIGNRLAQRPTPFPPAKMVMEQFGSSCVSFFAGLHIKDAASGFRAFNREAMEALVIHSNYSYTLESLILAGMKKLRIANVPITTNPPRRSSRLFKTLRGYLAQSTISILRAYLMYHPLRFFAGIGVVLLFAALLIGVRYLVFFYTGVGTGHIQSLILMAILAFLGFQSIVIGLIGDIISANRRLLEQLRISLLRGQKNGG
jgi:glycosyltransferase involved in cell wall biosynthesis